MSALNSQLDAILNHATSADNPEARVPGIVAT